MALNKILSFFQFNEDDFDDDEDDDIEIETAPKRSLRKTEESFEDDFALPRENRSDRLQRTAERTIERQPERQPERKPERKAERPVAKQVEATEYNSRPSRAASRPERQAPSKVVPIKSQRSGLEVTVTKPSSFDDSQDICDLLIRGKAVIANLEGFEPTEAQRVMDFISGCVYAMNGNLHQISKYIFIFSPDNIDLSGDFLDTMTAQGFGVPTINREF